MPEFADDQRDEPIDDETIIHLEGAAQLSIRSAGDPADEGLIAKAKARAGDPAIIDEHPPVFYTVKASDRVVDFYSTSMRDSTLANYAADATQGRGVPFLDSHNGSTIDNILGRSLEGKFVRGAGDEGRRVEITFYTQPTLEPRMQSFVNKSRGGYAKDVSVGFYGGQMKCSICGGEMLRWWRSTSDKPCYHMPGVEYKVVDASGTETGAKQMAIGYIENARLGEVSTVHKGANPNAGFIGFKARQLNDAGLLLPEVRAVVRDRYNITLPGSGRNWRGLAGDTKEGHMPPEASNQTGQVPESEVAARVQRAVDTERASWHDGLVGTLRVAGIDTPEGQDLVALVRSLADEVVTLRPQAEDGKAFRAALVKDAITEGVRAFGDKFDEERQSTRLNRMAVKDLELEIETWRAVGDRALPAGQGTDNGKAGDGDAPKKKPVNPALYRTRRPGR